MSPVQSLELGISNKGIFIFLKSEICNSWESTNSTLVLDEGLAFFDVVATLAVATTSKNANDKNSFEQKKILYTTLILHSQFNHS
jgi:hypothetical protein